MSQSDILLIGKRDVPARFSAISETYLGLAIGVVVGRTRYLGGIQALVNLLVIIVDANCLCLLYGWRTRSLALLRYGCKPRSLAPGLWTIIVIFVAAMLTLVRPQLFEDNLNRQSQVLILNIICRGLAGLCQLLRERKDGSPQWSSMTAVPFVNALPLVFLLLLQDPADIPESSQSARYLWTILALLPFLSIVTHRIRTPPKLDTKAINSERWSYPHLDPRINPHCANCKCEHTSRSNKRIKQANKCGSTMVERAQKSVPPVK